MNLLVTEQWVAAIFLFGLISIALALVGLILVFVWVING